MKAAPKFTPGPWRHDTKGYMSNLVEGPTGKRNNEADDGYRTICSVQDAIDSPKYVEQDANCMANIALIAAAPELYEALAKHQAFFDKLAAHCFGSDASEGGSDLEYSEFLELAESVGLLRVEGYDPDKHGHGADSAPGDTWYVPSHVGRAALAKALGEAVSS